MYLSSERIAIADKAVKDTFEQSSIAWQAIPHWDTGDPGQFRVRSDNACAPPPPDADTLADPILPGDSLPLDPVSIRFAVTVAQAIAPTPDAILAAVIARAVQLAGEVDNAVIAKLLGDGQGDIEAPWDIPTLLNALIDARARLEKSGYRSPSCLLTDTAGLKALNTLQDGLPAYQPVLDAANINSLYRFDEFDSDMTGRMLLLGRRQRIAHGGAASVSAGEEPVDLAVSVPPSLELVGETDKGYIELAVRIRFATRISDRCGVVGVDQS